MSADSRLHTHHDHIFVHAGEPRVGASVVMVGIVAVLIGSIFIAIGPPLKTNAPVVRTTSGESRSTPVRVVGATPREDVSCEQQTWPNIHQRCLSLVPRTDSSSPATQDDAKLSSLTATGAAIESQPGTRDVMSRDPGPQSSYRPPDALPVPARSDATVGFVNDTTQDLPSQVPPEPARKRVRKHFGFPFRFHF